MNFFRTISLLFLSVLFSYNYSTGQTNNPSPFELDFTKEAIILGAGSAAGVTALIILGNLQPLTQEEINVLNPADVNGFDRGAIGPYEEDHVGDALLYGSYLLPLTFLAYEPTNKDFLELALMYGEVLLIQGSVTGIIKGTVERTRPYVYDVNTPLDEKTTDKARLSFFSGHVSITAAITFFTAKVFSEYIEDNTTKILIWSGAALYPAITALMRVNTHSHFPTDVIAGYAFGALVGYFIPEFHKSKINKSVSIYPSININKPMLSVQIKF